MDSYQAIYDAVRSRIHSVDIGGIVERAIMDCGIGHAADMARESIRMAASEYERPSVVFRPSLFPDGNQWCALYGEDLATGVAGFGDTPAAAMWAFDNAWLTEKCPPSKHVCPRCGTPNPDNLDMDGCRDPNCPEQES